MGETPVDNVSTFLIEDIANDVFTRCSRCRTVIELLKRDAFFLHQFMGRHNCQSVVKYIDGIPLNFLSQLFAHFWQQRIIAVQEKCIIPSCMFNADTSCEMRTLIRVVGHDYES